MKWVTFFILFVPVGCKVIEYTDSGRTLRIVNFAFDTKIGKVTGESPDGLKITIENYDASQQALNVAAEALKKIP